MKKAKENKAGKDWCDRLHRTPGDTSEGRWLTVVFALIGVVLCAISFFLHQKFGHISAVMICICLFNIVFTYLELSHLFIRKYWFRYHRSFAVILCMAMYYVLITLVLLLAVHFYPTLEWQTSYLFFAVYLMPPMIVVILLAWLLMHVLGG